MTNKVLLDLSLPPLCAVLLPPSPLLTAFQPHYSPCWSLNMSGMHLPHGLCIGSSLCWEYSSPRYLPGSLNHALYSCVNVTSSERPSLITLINLCPSYSTLTCLSVVKCKLQKGSDCFSVLFSAICLVSRIVPSAEKALENYLLRE